MIDDQRGFSIDLPSWLRIDKDTIEVLAIPEREEIPSIVNEQLIVEFYSR